MRRWAFGGALLIALGLGAGTRVVVNRAADAGRPVIERSTTTEVAPVTVATAATAPAPTALLSTTDRPAPERAPAPAPPGVAAETADEEDGPPATNASLVASLRSDDPFQVHTAADELVLRKVVTAIPSLAAVDIRQSAHSGPSVISALGRLAADADGSLRGTAAERLLVLLAQEKARRAPESDGNVLLVYEALGQTHDPRAATALERELADPTVDWAAKTEVVAALVRLAQPSSAPALRALQGTIAIPATEAFDEEVRRELAVAIERALHQLG